jgi:hypothetical protein
MDLQLAPSKTTPEVILNSKDKVLIMKGRSSPENAVAFYDKILRVLDEYFKSAEFMEVHFMFEYFNTSSSKNIFDLLKKLKQHREAGKEVIINWVFEEYDEDMQETGEDYADLLDIDMNMIELESFSEHSVYQKIAS